MRGKVVYKNCDENAFRITLAHAGKKVDVLMTFKTERITPAHAWKRVLLLN